MNAAGGCGAVTINDDHCQIAAQFESANSATTMAKGYDIDAVDCPDDDNESRQREQPWIERQHCDDPASAGSQQRDQNQCAER